MTDQLQAWKSEFGSEYTDRNVVDWRTRLPAFQEMLKGLNPERVLEVGCNRGHNLVAIAEFLRNTDLVGIEPNPHAVEIARTASSKVGILHGNVYDLPFKDGFFDVVFTSGVLIHISLTDLKKALAEIHRVSRRHILSIEYFSEEETVIEYRGREAMLWKRNFLKHYQDQFEDLELIRSGYWEAEHHYLQAHWWLLEKNKRT